MNSLLIHPGLPEDMIRRSAEEVASYISSNASDIISYYQIEHNSDIVHALRFPEARELNENVIGDTVTVYHDPKKVFKMTFLDFGGNVDGYKYNVLASMLHNEGHKIWGTVLITCLDKETEDYVKCTSSDVSFLIYRRAWHKGLYYKKGLEAEPKLIEIDNAWNIRGENKSLSQNLKYRYTMDDGRPSIKVECQETGDYWLFLLLEDNGKILIDLEESPPKNDFLNSEGDLP